jgi:ppGpp synthetase/RelA/SpoT-type nucleotidyltranferase
VTLPTSRNQIDKLGKRLATLGRVDGSDRELFSQILDYYQSVLDDVCAILGTSNFRPTSRVKTTTTLAEKLSREHGIQLSRINDVAGARVVVEGGHLAQDAAVQGIVDLFSEEESHKPLVIDRRVDPRQGYRAVHVIIHYDGVPVEIQVRTELQDSWAQLFERLADQWGRGIRYGDKIDESTLEVWPEQSRAEIGGLLEEGLDLVMGVSKSIAHVEKARSRVEVIQAAYLGIVHVRVPAPMTPEERLELLPQYRDVRRSIVDLLARCETDRRRRGRVIRKYLKRDEPDVANVSTAARIAGRHAQQQSAEELAQINEAEGMLRSTLEILSGFHETVQNELEKRLQNGRSQ